MADDEIVAVGDEVDDVLSGALDELELFGRGVAERVAAEGDHDALSLSFGVRHVSVSSLYLRVAYMTALMVCMRFSASSKTLD